MSPAGRSKRVRQPGPGVPGTAIGPIEMPDKAIFVFSRTGIRSLDEAAVQELGIPSIILMEHASLALLRHAIEMAIGGGVLVVCGKGNNAGDGLALARHLYVRRIPVSVVLPPDAEYDGDARTNLLIARRLGVPIAEASPQEPGRAVQEAAARLGPTGLIVDAILGTGLTGPPRGPILGLIHAVNDHAGTDAPVLAVDIPSGLDADTGEAVGGETDVVRADRTVTFVGLKRGFLALPAQRILGDVYVEGIGTPLELAERFGERLTLAEHPGDSGSQESPAPRPKRPGQGRRR